MSTFNDILTAVQINVARNNTATNSMIWQAYCTVLDMVDRSQEWPELEYTGTKATVVGTDDYDLTTFATGGGAPKYIKSVVLNLSTTFYSPMFQYTRKKWDEQVVPGIPTTSRPTGFTYYGKRIYLNTSPDQIYTMNIRYQDRPTKPTSVSDTTAAVSFEDMDSLLIAMTTSITWSSLEEKTNMEMWANIAKSLVGGMTTEAQRMLDLSPAVGAKHTSMQTGGQTWLDPFRRN